MKLASMVTWAEENPVMAGGAVVVLGLGVLWVLGYFNGGGGGGDASAQAYYAAVAADAQSGNALQATQIAANASTAQTLIQASADVQNNQTWADLQHFTQQTNHDTVLGLAPYHQTEALISALGSVANQPPTVTESSKSSKGFGLFGLHIGGGSKSVQTVTPAPGSTAALDALTHLTDGPGIYGPH